MWAVPQDHREPSHLPRDGSAGHRQLGQGLWHACSPAQSLHEPLHGTMKTNRHMKIKLFYLKKKPNPTSRAVCSSTRSHLPPRFLKAAPYSSTRPGCL